MATLQQRVRFPASPKAVYALYADARLHAEVIAANVKLVKRPGGRFSAWDGYATGKILELVPGKRIVSTWRASDWPRTAADSVRRGRRL